MKYLLLIIACFSFQNLAHASIDGDWQGSGDWIYEGSGDHCDVRLSFRDSPTQFQRKSGDLSCSVVVMSIPSQTFLKQGQNLLLDGNIVGKMNGDNIELHENYSPTVTVVTNITVGGGHLDYQEIWYQKTGSVLYKIKARLFKQ